MDETIKPMSRTCLDQNMDMVRHHAPSEQRVPLAIEAQQCVLDEFSKLAHREITPSMSLIENIISPPDALLPWAVGDFALEMSGEAVGDPEYHVLNEVRRIQMRQVTA